MSVLNVNGAILNVDGAVKISKEHHGKFYNEEGAIIRGCGYLMKDVTDVIADYLCFNNQDYTKAIDNQIPIRTNGSALPNINDISTDGNTIVLNEGESLELKYDPNVSDSDHNDLNNNIPSAQWYPLTEFNLNLYIVDNIDKNEKLNHVNFTSPVEITIDFPVKQNARYKVIHKLSDGSTEQCYAIANINNHTLKFSVSSLNAFSVISKYISTPTGGDSGSGGGFVGEVKNDNKSTTQIKSDGTIVETKIETGKDGSTIETIKETKKDGSTIESKKETKNDGTTIESKNVTKKDGSTIESRKETKKDGSMIESKNVTKKDGATIETEKETKNDGSSIESKITKKDGIKAELTTETNEKGIVTQKNYVVTNTDGTQSTRIRIPKTANGASILVTSKKSADGEVVSTQAIVNQKGTKSKQGTGILLQTDTIGQVTELTGTNDLTVKIKVTDNTGKTKYNLMVNPKDLKPNAKLNVYIYNEKTGKYTKVKKATYTVDSDGNVKISLSKKKTYALLPANDSK